MCTSSLKRSRDQREKVYPGTFSEDVPLVGNKNKRKTYEIISIFYCVDMSTTVYTPGNIKINLITDYGYFLKLNLVFIMLRKKVHELSTLAHGSVFFFEVTGR